MKKGSNLSDEIKKVQNIKAPKQYQQGFTEFYKLKFKLTPDVLIPRPETELLVDEIIKFSKDKDSITVLDIGTGSGNIAISVAKNIPDSKIIATEVSGKALKIAEINAKFHKVLKQIIFLESDLLGFAAVGSKAPDVIVTNLPYIPTERLLYIDPMVVDFEPRVALDGGRDGFELYKKLFQQMKDKNFIPKLLLGEIDYTQGEQAIYEVKKYFPNAEVEVKTDLAHKQRILFVKF